MKWDIPRSVASIVCRACGTSVSVLDSPQFVLPLYPEPYKRPPHNASQAEFLAWWDREDAMVKAYYAARKVVVDNPVAVLRDRVSASCWYTTKEGKFHEHEPVSWDLSEVKQ